MSPIFVHLQTAIEEIATYLNIHKYCLTIVGTCGAWRFLLLPCFMMTSVMVAALGLVLLAIASTPTILTFIGKIKRRKRFAEDDNSPYEDNDGTATEESQKKFSTIIPRSLSVTGAIFGCLLSLAEAVLRTSNRGRYSLTESWLVFASWVGRILSFNKRSFVDSYRPYS